MAINGNESARPADLLPCAHKEIHIKQTIALAAYIQSAA